MEVITQILPTEDELLPVSESTRRKFVCEPDTYSYFLNLYENEIDSFISTRTHTDLPRPKGFQESLDRAALRAIHLKEFGRQRKKFHLYKGDIYIYRVLHGNVGHEVEAIRLNIHDALDALNEYSQPPPQLHIRLIRKLKALTFNQR